MCFINQRKNRISSGISFTLESNISPRIITIQSSFIRRQLFAICFNCGKNDSSQTS